MLRAQLVKLSEDDWTLMITQHHIASMVGFRTFMRELTAIYDALSRNESPQLAPLTIQYVDYTVWQHSQLQGEELERQTSYWRTQLQDLPDVHQYLLIERGRLSRVIKAIYTVMSYLLR